MSVNNIDDWRVKDNKPNIIIDFVKPKSFLYTNPEFGIKNSPLKNLIKKEYVKLENYNPECPDIYLKNKVQIIHLR